jgi:predicted transcriptional regulator
VQLSDEILADLDSRRAREGRSRFEIIREAILAYLATDREAAIDRAIVDGYTWIPATDESGADWAARATIAAEPWDGPERHEPVNRGEVWWLEHPEIGRRPACILTRQQAIPVLNRCSWPRRCERSVASPPKFFCAATKADHRRAALTAQPAAERITTR